MARIWWLDLEVGFGEVAKLGEEVPRAPRVFLLGRGLEGMGRDGKNWVVQGGSSHPGPLEVP